MEAWERIKFAIKLAAGMVGPESAEQAQGVLAGLISSKTSSYPDRNTEGLLNTYNESPWIRAIASKVADAVASTHWRLHTVRSRQTGKLVSARDLSWLKNINDPKTRTKLFHNPSEGEDIEEVKSHLFLDMLHNANSEMTGLEFRWILSTWLDLVGDAFFLKERNIAGKPVALWPLIPSWITDTPTVSKPFFRVSYRGWQTKIPESEVLWMKYMNPAKPYGRGSGVTKALDDEISIDDYSAKHSLAFFRNMGRPDLLVMPKPGGQLGVPERDRLEKWWSDGLQGFWRRFKPVFLTQPMDVTVIEQKFRDMQLTELRQSVSDTIFQTWGVSPEIFGRLASSNKATVEKAIEIFARYVLVPRLERIRESFQEKLLPEYDDRLILSYDSPIPMDQEFTLNVYKGQPNAFELNEWRALVNLAEIDELEGVFGSGSARMDREAPVGEEEPAKLENLSDVEIKQLEALLLKLGPNERIAK